MCSINVVNRERPLVMVLWHFDHAGSGYKTTGKYFPYQIHECFHKDCYISPFLCMFWQCFLVTLSSCFVPIISEISDHFFEDLGKCSV